MSFIAAMDHSGGSTGGVLERYGVEYTEDNKMDLVHQMRLRMINSPNFTNKNIWASILYLDSVTRGIVPILEEKGIEAYLKIDSGCEDNGYLKYFNSDDMIKTAINNGCTGTKMRSIIKDTKDARMILEQQFALAESIHTAGLMPIIEPEVPIDHPNKAEVEATLYGLLHEFLEKYTGQCILKLTLPEYSNFYMGVGASKKVHKVVGLSGGYTTEEACRRLSQHADMTASFSRGLSEGLFFDQSEEAFNSRINKNIHDINLAGSLFR